MKAKLADLQGKYYGTEVILEESENLSVVIKIWIGGNHKPSSRELEGYVLKGDGKWWLYDEEVDEWYDYEICDNHYETETSLEIAQLLVDAINNKEWDV